MVENKVLSKPLCHTQLCFFLNSLVNRQVAGVRAIQTVVNATFKTRNSSANVQLRLSLIKQSASIMSGTKMGLLEIGSKLHINIRTQIDKPWSSISCESNAFMVYCKRGTLKGPRGYAHIKQVFMLGVMV